MERSKPLLLWQPNIFPDEEKEIARQYFRIQYSSISDGNWTPHHPFVFRGSVSGAGRLGHNLDRFDCRKWIPYLSDYMISRNFFWATAKDLARQDQYVWPLFVRPDSCKKLFAGQVYSYEKYLEEYKYLQQKNGEKILAFVAKPEWIGREWRFLYVGEECVGYSDYMYNGEIIENPQPRAVSIELERFADRIRANEYFSPEDNVTIDVGQRADGSYGLVEINFLETAGFYGVDKDKVYDKLAQSLNYD